jgi:hypothetical protein
MTNAFALTFAFAPTHKGNPSKVKRECKPPHQIVQTFLQTLTYTAENLNFGQSNIKLDTTVLLQNSRAAGNNSNRCTTSLKNQVFTFSIKIRTH